MMSHGKSSSPAFLGAALCAWMAGCAPSAEGRAPGEETGEPADLEDAPQRPGGAGGSTGPRGTGGDPGDGSITGGADGGERPEPVGDAARAEADGGQAPPPDGDSSLPDAATDSAAPATVVTKVFLDTDLVIDPGDMGTMAMLHGLADRCEIEIIGITAVTTVEGAAGTLDATNTYYGRPDIPIGVLKGAPFLNRSGYAGRIARDYPNDFRAGAAAAPEATALFRKVIAAQPDGSVALVAVGPLRNLKNFVESGPDDASPLSGRDLISKKIKVVSIMGGHFENSSFREWNMEQDVASAKAVASKWPGRMVWGGFEAGIGFQPDWGIIAKRPKSPVTFAFNNAGGDSGPRPGWDQTSLLYVARPGSPYWKLSAAGKVTVRDDATTIFQRQAAGQHVFIDSVEVSKAPPEELVGVTVGKYGKITAIMDDLEANAGHVGACRPPGSPASRE